MEVHVAHVHGILPLEGLFAEKVSLVEVPDELLLLRAVLLLRDLDLQRRKVSETRGRPNLRRLQKCVDLMHNNRD